MWWVQLSNAHKTGVMEHMEPTSTATGNGQVGRVPDTIAEHRQKMKIEFCFIYVSYCNTAQCVTKGKALTAKRVLTRVSA